MMTVREEDAPMYACLAMEAAAVAGEGRHQLATSLPTTNGTERPEPTPHRAAVRLRKLWPQTAETGEMEREQMAMCTRRCHFHLQKAYHFLAEVSTRTGLHKDTGLPAKCGIGNAFALGSAIFPNLAARLLALLDARIDLPASRRRVRGSQLAASVTKECFWPRCSRR